MGSLLCREESSGRVDRLVRIEVWLSLVGGVSVLLQSLWDLLFRYLDWNYSFLNQGVGEWILWLAYLSLCYGVIVAIGLLSGFELPLLISLRQSEKEGTTNTVLGVDYLGSLVGAVCFPLLLWPQLGLFATASLIGLLNVLACVLLLASKPSAHKRRHLAGTLVIGVLLVEGLFYTPHIEQFFLKKLYYYREVDTIRQLVDPLNHRPDVKALRSPYQRIHLVHNPDSEDHYRVYGAYSEKFLREPDFPKGYYLFLNRAFQFYSGVEEFWHEYFVHVPIQWTRPPGKVLILGGGDGIVARELLKYEQVEEIMLVDIDPVMLELARHDPIVSRINKRSLWNPRLRVVNADAFSWVRECRESYDAIYIDMPDPLTYEISKVYSLEFYSLVKRCLTEKGFIAADIPYSEPYDRIYLWRQYYSTFHAAGFKQIRRFATTVESNNPAVEEFEQEWISRREDQDKAESGGRTREEKREVHRREFRRFVNKIIYALNQGFVFLRKEQSPMNTIFQDHRIPLYVLNRERLKLSARFDYPETYSPREVNSIFHPTIPTIELATEFAPYHVVFL